MAQFVLAILISKLDGGGPILLGVSSIFPMGMAAWIVKFNFLALNYSHTIAFGNLFSFKFSGGLTVGLCLVSGWLFTLFLLLVLAYIWPLYIAVDADNPLSPWYPLTCACCKDDKAKKSERAEAASDSDVSDDEGTNGL
jgi:hypothetical protein